MNLLVTAVKPLVSVAKWWTLRAIADVAHDGRQVAQHQVVVVRLGVEEPSALQTAAAGLDLLHQPPMHLRHQIGRRLRPHGQQPVRHGFRLGVLLGQIEDAFVSGQGQVDDRRFRLLIGNRLALTKTAPTAAR